MKRVGFQSLASRTLNSMQNNGQNTPFWIKDEVGNIRLLKYSNIQQEKSAASREIMQREEEIWRFFSEFWSKNNGKWNAEMEEARANDKEFIYSSYLKRNRGEFRQFHREWLSRLWKLGKLYLRKGLSG